MAKGGKLVMDKAVIAGNPNLPEIVYCYQFPSRRDRIKIGYSSRGLRRIVEQSTGFPENPEVLFVIHDHRAATIEKELHALLSEKQAAVLGQEWFGAGMKDVLAVSPILRKAAKKQKWRSVPKLFGAGALFGVGVFMAPLVALAIIEFWGAGDGVSGWEIVKDYFRSPFSEDISTFDLAYAIFEYLKLSNIPMAFWAIILASPAVLAGLAYVSFRKQTV